MGKPMYARSLKPLTEPKDVEFHTAKRQRMQGKQEQVSMHHTSCRRFMTLVGVWQT